MTGQPQKDEVIRISAGEANSARVDDLLRRQASMRGERGVGRSRPRWYYQNWFLFGIAGAAAAFLAWALSEPVFDDLPYLQGTVTETTLVTTGAGEATGGEEGESPPLSDIKVLDPDHPEQGAVDLGFRGSITLHGERILIGHFTKEIKTRRPAASTLFAEGKRLGIHVQVLPAAGAKLGEESSVSLALFVDPAPPATGDTTMSLERLARRSHMMGLMIFTLIAALVGLFIGAADGIICRLWRRALLAGGVGLVVGAFGGFALSLLANVLYSWLNGLATRDSGGLSGMTPAGFGLQVIGRTLAWGIVGIATGLGQGIALRSQRLLVFGLIGGVVGGLLGGMLFDPIDLLMLGSEKPSAHISRMVGFTLIGLSVGVMVGVVELFARDTWLRMEQGPLAGKEFLIFKDQMRIGASPRSDIFLFNDPGVAPHHATLRAVGEDVEIETTDRETVLVNERPVQRSRLRHGDRIGLGRTVFVFQQRAS